MPTSWPKDDVTLSSHGLLRFMTLPSQQPHTRTDSSAWSTHQLSTKEIFVFCFLAWRGVPGVNTTPFSSIASCLGAFFGPVSQKRTLSLFIFIVFPVLSLFFFTTTLEHCVARSSTLTEKSMMARSLFFTKPKTDK
jgi:hypothetical protein